MLPTWRVWKHCSTSIHPDTTAQHRKPDGWQKTVIVKISYNIFFLKITQIHRPGKQKRELWLFLWKAPENPAQPSQPDWCHSIFLQLWGPPHLGSPAKTGSSPLDGWWGMLLEGNISFLCGQRCSGSFETQKTVSPVRKTNIYFISQDCICINNNYSTVSYQIVKTIVLGYFINRFKSCQ